MKSTIVAAIMALSVFASMGFATFPMPSTSVASYLDASGMTNYNTASQIFKPSGMVAYTVETWNNFGTISSLNNVKAGIGMFGTPWMQTTEGTQVTGVSNVAQITGWTFAGAGIYNNLTTPTFFHAEEVNNFGSGTYLYSADITGPANFGSAIGINKPRDCVPEIPKTPTFPSCLGIHCA